MVSKFYSKCRIELSCIWFIKFFIFRRRFNLFLRGVNSLSGIFHLSVDISVLIFSPRTPTVDYHQLQPLSLHQTFEKIRKATKKTKLMFFMLTLVQWIKVPWTIASFNKHFKPSLFPWIWKIPLLLLHHYHF